MKRLCVALFLLVAAFSADDASSQGATGIPRELDVRDCFIMQTFARVWEDSPLVEREFAVWIVANPEGNYEAIDWANETLRRTAHWSQALPKNIIAQAHTHGDHLDPKPSAEDANVARRLNIWVYTLTRKGIWRVGPDGQITQQMGRGWFKNAKDECPAQQVNRGRKRWPEPRRILLDSFE